MLSWVESASACFAIVEEKPRKRPTWPAEWIMINNGQWRFLALRWPHEKAQTAVSLWPIYVPHPAVGPGNYWWSVIFVILVQLYRVDAKIWTLLNCAIQLLLLRRQRRPTTTTLLSWLRKYRKRAKVPSKWDVERDGMFGEVHGLGKYIIFTRTRVTASTDLMTGLLKLVKWFSSGGNEQVL